MVKQFRPGFLALTAMHYPLEFGGSFLVQLGGDFKYGENLGHYNQTVMGPVTGFVLTGCVNMSLELYELHVLRLCKRDHNFFITRL